MRAAVRILIAAFLFVAFFLAVLLTALILTAPFLSAGPPESSAFSVAAKRRVLRRETVSDHTPLRLHYF